MWRDVLLHAGGGVCGEMSYCMLVVVFQNKLRAAAVKTTANISVLIKVCRHGYHACDHHTFCCLLGC